MCFGSIFRMLAVNSVSDYFFLSHMMLYDPSLWKPTAGHALESQQAQCMMSHTVLATYLVLNQTFTAGQLKKLLLRSYHAQIHEIVSCMLISAQSSIMSTTTTTKPMEIHQYWTVPRQTQRMTTPSFAEKWRLQYNHWRKGGQLESTTSQQNWSKQVERM